MLFFGRECKRKFCSLWPVVPQWTCQLIPSPLEQLKINRPGLDQYLGGSCLSTGLHSVRWGILLVSLFYRQVLAHRSSDYQSGGPFHPSRIKIVMAFLRSYVECWQQPTAQLQSDVKSMRPIILRANIIISTGVTSLAIVK